MKRKFISNLFLLLLLNFLVKPFWVFGIDRTVQNLVGAEQYGLYFSLFNFSVLLNIFLDFGINNFNTRNISQNSTILEKSFANIIVLKFFLALVYLVISVSTAIIIGYKWNEFRILLFLIFNQFLLSFILYFRSNLSGLHLFKADTIISVLDRTVMIAICAMLIWGNILNGPFRIEWFIYAQSVAYIITLVVVLALNIIKAGWVKIQIDPIYLYALLKKSFPYATLALFMSLYYRLDSIMLERLLPETGDAQSGVYAQSFRIIDAFVMLPVLFAGLLLPIFSKIIKANEPVGQLVRFSFLLLLVPIIIVSASLMVYKNEFMHLLYLEYADDSSRVLGLLLFSLVLISVIYIFGTLLTANGNILELNIISITAVAVNVILNYMLIPEFGAAGSAIASICTHFLVFALQFFLVFRLFKFSIDIMLIGKLIIFVLCISAAGYFIPLLVRGWAQGFFVLTATGFLLAFLGKLINLKQIYQLFRYGEEI